MWLEKQNQITDDGILEEFGRLRLPATVGEFRKSALEAGSPSALCSYCAERFRLRSAQEEFLYRASVQLWKRHLKDAKCAEVMVDHLSEIISYHENLNVHNRDSLLKIYSGVEEFYRSCLKEDVFPMLNSIMR